MCFLLCPRYSQHFSSSFYTMLLLIVQHSSQKRHLHYFRFVHHCITICIHSNQYWTVHTQLFKRWDCILYLWFVYCFMTFLAYLLLLWTLFAQTVVVWKWWLYQSKVLISKLSSTTTITTTTITPFSSSSLFLPSSSFSSSSYSLFYTPVEQRPQTTHAYLWSFAVPSSSMSTLTYS